MEIIKTIALTTLSAIALAFTFTVNAQTYQFTKSLPQLNFGSVDFDKPIALYNFYDGVISNSVMGP